jgi:hypothetical protein
MEHLDPEDARAIIDPALQLMVAVSISSPHQRRASRSSIIRSHDRF